MRKLRQPSPQFSLSFFSGFSLALNFERADFLGAGVLITSPSRMVSLFLGKSDKVTAGEGPSFLGMFSVENFDLSEASLSQQFPELGFRERVYETFSSIREGNPTVTRASFK